MREFNIPYNQLKTIREEEPIKWEFWKSFLSEEGDYHERMIKKSKKGRKR